MKRIEQLSSELEDRGIQAQKDVPLSTLTTFRVGGPCDLLVSPASSGQIAEVLRLIREMELPMTVIGRGSNVLFSDEGFRGVVLRISSGFAAVRDLGGGAIECDAGLSLKALCEHACKRGLSGLEFAFGIPGTVGGAVYMNAGAYGGEMKDVLTQASHLDENGVEGTCKGDMLDFSYRHSVYSDSGLVITSARMTLHPGDPTEIRAKMDDYMARRKEKQPLDLPSAGSTFKRPEGNYASALIDRCGLKGLRVGGAAISEKHAGFVVNLGGATCSDILALIAKVQEDILRRTGYRLECEVKYMGSEGKKEL